jgi:hypothetical protein
MARMSIASSLDPVSRVIGNPHRLLANAGIAFQGAIVLGLGFTMAPEAARQLIEKDFRNAEVLFPYLNGEDVNSRPDCSAARYVINFHDWPEERARQYEDCYSQVLNLVRPERLKNNRKVYRENWWQYGEKRPAMVRRVAGLHRLIVITLVSKAVMPVMVTTSQVFSHMLGVFTTDDTAMLALLSSTPHHWWAISQASTLETRIRYTPSDVFETFPRPGLTEQLQRLGGDLDMRRRQWMLARKAGLTRIYNLVHDSHCKDADIAELRRTHQDIDYAVSSAYGWKDLELDHGFHETRQGVRYTVGQAARQEILDRLLELNQERYAAEVAAGLHDRKRGRRDAAGQGELFR